MGGEQMTLVGAMATAVCGLAWAVKTLYQDNKAKDATIADALRILEKSADALPQVVEAIDRLRNALPQPKTESTKREKN